VHEDPESETDDEEEVQLGNFWRNLRIPQQESPDVAEQVVADNAQARPWGSRCVEDAEQPSGPGPERAPVPVRSLTAAAARDAGAESQRLSAVSEQLSRRSWEGARPQSANRRRVAGVKLWRWPPDMTFEVLCFLLSVCVRELATTCTALRAACGVQTEEGWKLITPHLSFNASSWGLMLRRVWLPRALWLEARDLGAIACRTLLAGLKDRGPAGARALLTLDLRNARLSGAGDVTEVASACRGLQSLDLSRTRLRDDGLALLARGLLPRSGTSSAVHNSLKILTLEENMLTRGAGSVLADLAMGGTPLEALLLARNELGDTGAQALASALQGGSRLARLDLSENGLAADGLAALLGTSPVGGSSALRSLDVGGNEKIGAVLAACPELAEEVARGLSGAMKLRDLHLWRCGLADAAYLLVERARPPHLELLNVATNPFSTSLRERLLRPLQEGCLAAWIRL